MKSKIVITSILIILIGFARAQQPDLLPPVETEPLELTPFNIILYFVVPLFLLVFFLWYRKSKRKK
jgi:hypothetical protein